MRDTYATPAPRPVSDGPALDGTGEVPEITAERPSGVDAGDRAREVVADLLSLPQSEANWLAQMSTDTRRAAEERALIEAYRRGVERGKRAGRTEAADELWAWAEESEPIRPGEGPSARRRTIRAAAQRIAPEPTDEEMAAALVEVLEGRAPGCVLRGELPGAAGGTR